MVNIFATDITARHNYVFKLVFGHWLNEPWRIIQSEDEFNNAEGIAIRYTEQPGNDGIFIKASGLLSENNIRTFYPKTDTQAGTPVIFPGKDLSSEISFDIFSAIFWMVSRYEEYLPFTPDHHGRFEAGNSFAFKAGFNKKPVVDLWIKQFVQTLQKKYPQFDPKGQTFSFLPTYDIDQAWEYLHKNVIRSVVAGLRDYYRGRRNLVRERVNVLSKKVQDPSDSYDIQFALQEKYNLHPVYFFHPGTYGKYDKNISLKNPAFKDLIHRIKEKAEIGIHPSYRSAEEKGLLEKEVELLSKVSGLPINKCRHHFLRIKLPETYRKYISCGITDDYSLGWASDNGFRAGTSRSFPFYDLEKEETTELMIHPLVMMDGAYKNYLKLTPDEATIELDKLIVEVKNAGGTFISLFHNHTLGSSPLWSGWKEVYEKMIVSALTGNEKLKGF
jgi:hypothetical protein